MNITGLKTRLTKDYCWYNLLFVPALVFMLSSLCAGFTPVFDALPSEFNGFARLLAVAVAVMGLLMKDEGRRKIKLIIFPAAAAVGLLFVLEEGVTYVLDAAVILLLIVCADIRMTALTVFSFFSAVTGATFILGMKGFVRVYDFGGISSFGFRNPAGLYFSLLMIIAPLIVVIYLWIRERKTSSLLFKGIFAVLVSAVTVVAVLKAQNLAAPVEAGSYEIYGADTVMGLEVKMKGFDDYSISFGNTAPTSFTITPSGDNYEITIDSYGVRKTLCILDGKLYAGNYEQSSYAHTWSIEEIAGTPYFTLTNVETGLAIAMREDGYCELRENCDDACLMRIGSENLEYYGDDPVPVNDLCAASVIAPDRMTYTGSAVCPDITVDYGGFILEEGTDYEVMYWDNYLPGTAYIEVRGIGDYTGTCSKSFAIMYGNHMLDDPFYRDTSDYVIRVYRMAYLRYPSLDEVRSYVQVLVGSNRTPDSVIWEVYNNGGFVESDAAFIEAVYRLMLLRNGSRDELTLWINELRSGSTREDVIDAISVSPDYQNIWHNFGIGYR
ncbi:MAG: DUF4214 domain-containing protein [Clostridiales bacterium]|nr:DUF4214 domain-containing protein [Clostridiales bacterium]